MLNLRKSYDIVLIRLPFCENIVNTENIIPQ